MPARPFLATSRWLRLTMGDNGTTKTEKERGRKRETEKKIGLPFRERVLGLQAISRTLFCPIPPPPNAPLFSLPSILLPSFTLTVASSSLSFPLYRHRRGGPALIYLHPRARRRRRGVFIFCPASARCKVYRRDLHRFAFCFPSCSVVVVFVYAPCVLIRTRTLAIRVCARVFVRAICIIV